MVRLSLIDYGPHIARIAPIFPATAFSEMTHGYAVLPDHSLHAAPYLFPIREVAQICVDLSGKAFENVLDKYPICA
jgi:hypothetical protein